MSADPRSGTASTSMLTPPRPPTSTHRATRAYAIGAHHVSASLERSPPYGEGRSDPRRPGAGLLTIGLRLTWEDPANVAFSASDPWEAVVDWNGDRLDRAGRLSVSIQPR
jgi:hypothetical protein